jgi:hypothetical protein
MGGPDWRATPIGAPSTGGGTLAWACRPSVNGARSYGRARSSSARPESGRASRWSRARLECGTLGWCAGLRGFC